MKKYNSKKLINKKSVMPLLNTDKEDLLSILYHLIYEKKKADINEIAEYLKISRSSVLKKIRKMVKEGLIRYSPSKKIELTDKGQRAGADIVRRHRLSERFLADKLGIKWELVHDEAHKMEHGISKLVDGKLYKILGRPKTCPHGNPVPDAHGRIKEKISFPLSNFNKNDKVSIVKITKEEPKFLCYLATLGLMPGTGLEIEEKAPFNGPIMVKVGSTIYALGKEIADEIWVKRNV